MHKVNDFFCGCGGMGLGFKQAGFATAGAWDYDKFAVESYRHNVDAIVQQSDIQQMRFDDIPAADVWTFGFPCQDLSIAGMQKGLHDGERSRLFFEIMRLLDELDMMGEDKPKVIMAENVKALKPYLELLEAEYGKRGYRTYYTLYNSKFWGVPQNRERYFVLGVRDDIEKEFVFPEQGKTVEKRLIDVLDKDVDESYYLSEEKKKAILDRFILGSGEAYSAPLKFIDRNQKILPEYAMCVDCSQSNGVALPVIGSAQKHAARFDNLAPSVTAHAAKGGGSEIMIVQEATKKGYAVAEVGDSINLAHPNSKTRRGRVGVAQTLLTSCEQYTIAPEDYRVRKLTPTEYGRLQGFPMDDGWEQVVSNSQAYKQFGNAVTVNVAEAIAKAIIEQLLDKEE